MKVELNIDTQELVKEITREVIRELKPYLTGTGKGEDDTLKTRLHYSYRGLKYIENTGHYRHALD